MKSLLCLAAVASGTTSVAQMLAEFKQLRSQLETTVGRPEQLAMKLQHPPITDLMSYIKVQQEFVKKLKNIDEQLMILVGRANQNTRAVVVRAIAGALLDHAQKMCYEIEAPMFKTAVEPVKPNDVISPGPPNIPLVKSTVSSRRQHESLNSGETATDEELAPEQKVRVASKSVSLSAAPSDESGDMPESDFNQSPMQTEPGQHEPSGDSKLDENSGKSTLPAGVVGRQTRNPSDLEDNLAVGTAESGSVAQTRPGPNVARAPAVSSASNTANVGGASREVTQSVSTERLQRQSVDEDRVRYFPVKATPKLVVPEPAASFEGRMGAEARRPQPGPSTE